MTRWLSLVAAVALPALVLAGGLGALERVRTADDLTQENNVGAVLNGRRVRQPLLDAMDALLDRTAPEVVVMGNSIANSDFVAGVFAKETGIEGNRIARLSVPNTMAAHWYAILENRVYARGHHPKLVIVISDLQSLLATVPRSEASHVALSLQMGDDEPVIDGKLGRRFWALERIRENRTVARDRALRAVRNGVVDLLVHGSFRHTDPKVTEEALGRVFAEDRVDNRLHKRVLPVFNETTPFAVTFEEDELAPLDQGFLPDLQRLVSEHGGTLVFVRPPMSPRLPAGYGDVVPDALAAQVGPAMRAAGHQYLDLRAMPLNASHFQNLDHMNEEGARRFTRVLVAALEDVGVVGQPAPGVDLLRSFDLVDDVLVPRVVEVAFEKAPPFVPGGRLPFEDGRGRSGWFPAGAFPGLADLATLEVSPQGSRCSPIRVVELSGGAEVRLGPANVTCEELFKLGGGRTCHTADRVYFSASDGTDPWDNGRDYKMVLDPARACPESRWTYPKDTATFGVPDGPAPITGVTLGAADLGSTGRGGARSVAIELLAGDRTVASREVPLWELVRGAYLDCPATPAEGLRLRVSNRSDHFLLWRELKLRAAPQ